MKTMKYICMAAAVMMLAACSDFLDKDPEAKLPEEEVDYTNTANMYQPVSGVYAKIRTGAMHWVIYPQVAVRDDDMWSGRTDDQQLLVDFGNYKYDNTFWGSNEMWNQYYGIIKVANSALESLDAFAANASSNVESTYRSYCGEVRFLRAYSYFRLVQAFGPVTILRTNDQADMTRSTVQAVYNYVLEDLQYTMDNTPKLRPNEMDHIGAVTAYSAEALAAKIYLNMGNYSEVEQLTDDIISSGKFELYSDYYELFKIPGKLCNEFLFECQCTDFGTGDGEMVDVDQWFVFQGPGTMGGWNFMRYYESFRDWAEARGETVRATTAFLIGTTPSGDEISETTEGDAWNGKTYTPRSELTPGRTKYGANNNVRILRYADVLLMNAEAKVRQGKDGDAPFNLVRDRAGMEPVTGVTVDQILDERRIELCGEWGERYNDLVRTGQAAAVLGPKGWSADKTYYPVPFSQISISSDLTKDPIE